MKNLTKKSLTTLLIVGVASVALMSCRKNTKAQFVLNKYEYSAGEMLDVTNVNPKKKQVWSISDEFDMPLDTIFDSQPQFVLSLLEDDGIYSLNLYDNEAELKKDVKTSKVFIVKTIRSLLKISANSTSDKKYTVYVDGEKMGSTTNGKYNVDLPIGSRYLKIMKDNSFTPVTGTVLLKEGSSEYFSF